MPSTEAHLPECPTPRPGERVVYYRSDTQFQGVFQGYNTLDQLLVQNSSGGITTIDNFMQVRLLDPTTRALACWHNLPADSKMETATKEKAVLDALLEQRIPPGPRYIDFVQEIWARGYEAFLVGGSVRDALNGDVPSDVDLVTTMPFFFLEAVAESMFGALGFSRHRENGFMSVGRDAARGRGREITIDVKNFFRHAPGTADAEFGSDLSIDHRLRDFTCNSVYYDPINAVLIDPSGSGIEDARSKTLNVVHDPALQHPVFRKAHIAMRFFGFVCRGYLPSEPCALSIRDTYKPLLAGVGTQLIQSLFQRSVLNKVDDSKKAQTFWKSKELMELYGFGDIWDAHLRRLERTYGGRE